MNQLKLKAIIPVCRFGFFYACGIPKNKSYKITKQDNGILKKIQAKDSSDDAIVKERMKDPSYPEYRKKLKKEDSLAKVHHED